MPGILLGAGGRAAIRSTGKGLLIPDGGVSVLDACCCDDPSGTVDCTKCRRHYTGVNYIWQQDRLFRAPVKTLLGHFGPVYRSAFTRASNDVDLDDDPGAHRCWEIATAPSGGGTEPGGEEESESSTCEDPPSTDEFCRECTDSIGPDTYWARPCGWIAPPPVSAPLVSGDVLPLACPCKGPETWGPWWYWIGRTQFVPDEINHCIRSALISGTLTGADPDVFPWFGAVDRCGRSPSPWCPTAGNCLRLKINVGGQELITFGAWGSSWHLRGGWSWRDAAPLLTDAAWGDLPWHRGDHHVAWTAICDDDDDTLTFWFSFVPGPMPGPGCPSGGYGWNDPDDVAISSKRWTVPRRSNWTITDMIKRQTPLGGAGMGASSLTITGEWITVL